MMAKLSVAELRRVEGNPHRSSTTVREKLFIGDPNRADELEAEIDSAYGSEPVPRTRDREDDVEKSASPVRHDDEYALSTQSEAGFPPGESPVTSN